MLSWLCSQRHQVQLPSVSWAGASGNCVVTGVDIVDGTVALSSTRDSADVDSTVRELMKLCVGHLTRTYLTPLSSVSYGHLHRRVGEN